MTLFNLIPNLYCILYVLLTFQCFKCKVIITRSEPFVIGSDAWSKTYKLLSWKKNLCVLIFRNDDGSTCFWSINLLCWIFLITPAPAPPALEDQRRTKTTLLRTTKRGDSGWAQAKNWLKLQIYGVGFKLYFWQQGKKFKIIQNLSPSMKMNGIACSKAHFLKRKQLQDVRHVNIKIFWSRNK